MASDFNSRFTHALLICVIMLLIKEPDNPWHEMLHFQALVLACFAWAFWYPKFRVWAEKREAGK